MIERRPLLTFTSHVVVLLGILVGVLPGLGAPNGVTLLLPLTFSMQPVSAIILLASMYWGALFGGSTTSILFNIPGEPSSVASTFDGYPMARDGRATEALSYAFLSAGFGAMVGVLVITMLSTFVADFALRLEAVESSSGAHTDSIPSTIRNWQYTSRRTRVLVRFPQIQR